MPRLKQIKKDVYFGLTATLVKSGKKWQGRVKARTSKGGREVIVWRGPLRLRRYEAAADAASQRRKLGGK